MSAFTTGIAEGLTKVAEFPEPVGEMMERGDARVTARDELLKIQDPAERARYLADMSARNHPLAMILRRRRLDASK